MEKRFQIGEIAHFFNLPASTLRYWDACGIMRAEKNKENQYRSYTVADLMTISDIIFYKSLGLSLKQIRDMEKAAPCGQRQLLDEKMQALAEEQTQLLRRAEKLRRHLAAMDTLEELRRHPYTETDIDADGIVSFELIEQDKLCQYIENPYLYSRVQHSDNPDQEQRGMTVSEPMLCELPASQVLWRKNSNTYIVCLLKEEITGGFPNNLQEHLFHIQKFHKTGAIISRFLLCAQEDGKLYDFYKTFVEILCPASKKIV